MCGAVPGRDSVAALFQNKQHRKQKNTLREEAQTPPKRKTTTAVFLMIKRGSQY